ISIGFIALDIHLSLFSFQGSLPVFGPPGSAARFSLTSLSLDVNWYFLFSLTAAVLDYFGIILFIYLTATFLC
uniref:hypothetical protein n=1 Tax=Desulforadius tongensis TaxID=1216062 RepID=UPI00195AEF08